MAIQDVVNGVITALGELVKAPANISKGIAKAYDLRSPVDYWKEKLTEGSKAGYFGAIAQNVSGGGSPTQLDFTPRKTMLDDIMSGTPSIGESPVAKGIGAVKTETPAPTPATTPAPAPVAEQLQSGQPKPNAPKTIHEAVNNLSDKDYYEFSESHPHIPGLGSTWTGDKPKFDKKGKAIGGFERIVSPPKPEGDIELPDMTNYQAEIFAKVLHGVGSVALGTAQKEAARGLAKEKLDIAREGLDEKVLQDYKTSLQKTSPKIIDESGGTQFNIIPGLVRDYSTNRSNVPKKLLPLAQAASADKQKHFVDFLRSNPKIPPDQAKRMSAAMWEKDHSAKFSGS